MIFTKVIFCAFMSGTKVGDITVTAKVITATLPG